MNSDLELLRQARAKRWKEQQAATAAATSGSGSRSRGSPTSRVAAGSRGGLAFKAPSGLGYGGGSRSGGGAGVTLGTGSPPPAEPPAAAEAGTFADENHAGRRADCSSSDAGSLASFEDVPTGDSSSDAASGDGHLSAADHGYADDFEAPDAPAVAAVASSSDSGDGSNSGGGGGGYGDDFEAPSEDGNGSGDGSDSGGGGGGGGGSSSSGCGPNMGRDPGAFSQPTSDSSSSSSASDASVSGKGKARVVPPSSESDDHEHSASDGSGGGSGVDVGGDEAELDGDVAVADGDGIDVGESGADGDEAGADGDEVEAVGNEREPVGDGSEAVGDDAGEGGDEVAATDPAGIADARAAVEADSSSDAADPVEPGEKTETSPAAAAVVETATAAFFPDDDVDDGPDNDATGLATDLAGEPAIESLADATRIEGSTASSSGDPGGDSVASSCDASVASASDGFPAPLAADEESLAGDQHAAPDDLSDAGSLSAACDESGPSPRQSPSSSSPPPPPLPPAARPETSDVPGEPGDIGSVLDIVAGLNSVLDEVTERIIADRGDDNPGTRDAGSGSESETRKDPDGTSDNHGHRRGGNDRPRSSPRTPRTPRSGRARHQAAAAPSSPQEERISLLEAELRELRTSTRKAEAAKRKMAKELMATQSTVQQLERKVHDLATTSMSRSAMSTPRHRQRGEARRRSVDRPADDGPERHETSPASSRHSLRSVSTQSSRPPVEARRKRRGRRRLPPTTRSPAAATPPRERRRRRRRQRHPVDGSARWRRSKAAAAARVRDAERRQTLAKLDAERAAEEEKARTFLSKPGRYVPPWLIRDLVARWEAAGIEYNIDDSYYARKGNWRIV